MLRIMHALKGYKLAAIDDEFGTVQDFLFDEEHWAIRYMVADTGRWLPGRQVLISPVSLEKPDWTKEVFSVNMTREQIEEAPSLATDAPVSRQYEIEWYRTMGIPEYWGYSYAWGTGMQPWDLMLNAEQLKNASPARRPEEQDRVLRSVEEVRKYRIHASDGEIGHVKDFIMDDASWIIRYLVIDTRNWLPGKTVLIAPQWTDAIHWEDNTISTSLRCDEIKSAPEFDSTAPVNRAYEQQLYDYYGRPVYWS